LMSAQSSLAALSGQLNSTPGSIGGGAGGVDSNVAAIRSQIAQAHSRGWTDNHPDMIALRSQLAAAIASGGGRSAGSAATQNPVYVTLRSMQAEKQGTVAMLSSRKAQLTAEMSQYQAKMAAAPEVAAEQAQINRDYDILKSQYDKLLQDREDIRLRGDVQTQTDPVKFRVIDPPSVPGSPSAPNRPLLLLGMLLAGLGIGAAIAFGLGQLHPTYTTAAKLERVSGLSVIGAITEVVSPKIRRDRRKKLRLFFAGLGGLAAVWMLLLVIDMVQRSGVA
jgi:polysaccharide biosynthesis transport protein